MINKCEKRTFILTAIKEDKISENTRKMYSLMFNDWKQLSLIFDFKSREKISQNHIIEKVFLGAVEVDTWYLKKSIIERETEYCFFCPEYKKCLEKQVIKWKRK